jgi:hypothetical protein
MAKPRGRKWVLRAVICVVGAAAFSYAVGVLSASSANQSRFQGSVPAVASRPGWLPASWPEASTAERWTGVSSGFSHTETFFRTSAHEPPGNPDTYVLERDTFGWPFPALVRFSAGVQHGPASLRGEPLRQFFAEFAAAAGARAGREKARGKPTPVWPFFPGFALDTAFYAAIAFGLLSGPGAIRRRVRRAGGRCPACDYDLSGLPPGSPCPECAEKPPPPH